MTVTPEMIEAGARAGYESHFAHEWTGGDGVEAELWRQVACNSYAAMKALDPEVERLRHDIRFLLACLDICDEAEAPPSELDALDQAILGDIRRDNPQTQSQAQEQGK